MSHFDLVCSRFHVLYDLIRTCISERVAFNVAIPFNMLIKRSGHLPLLLLLYSHVILCRD